MAKPARSSKRNRSSISIAKIIVGVILFLGGVVVLLNKDKGNVALSSTFKNEPIEVRELKLTNQIGDKPERIIIPTSNIDLEVKEAKVMDGYWQVFEDKAGWGEGSGLPGQNGNQVIFAHARDELFAPLRFVEVGNKVFILTNGKYFEYQVKEIKEVYPGQTETIAPTEYETLTLYTCSGFADAKRLVVKAERI